MARDYQYDGVTPRKPRLHHYVRVYAHGPNAFWYKCAGCGGKGYTEDGYDITYADLCTLPTQYTCETCVSEHDAERLRPEPGQAPTTPSEN